MDSQMEAKPAAVPEAANQAGEVRDRWSWVEPTAWTQRMLTALEYGVKGDKWFALIDKVYSAANLQAAYTKVKANRGAAGVDRVSIDKWIRMRLRSILRKRSKRRGRGRGSDHKQWPNVFFAERGLFSLAQARATYRQPLVR
jgi:hypothetical protein